MLNAYFFFLLKAGGEEVFWIFPVLSTNFQSWHLPWNCHVPFWQGEGETGRELLAFLNLTSESKLSSLCRSQEPQGRVWRQGCSQTVGWEALLHTAWKLLKQINLRLRSWIVLRGRLFIFFWELLLALECISLEVGGSLNLAAFRAVCFWICFHFFLSFFSPKTWGSEDSGHCLIRRENVSTCAETAA